MPVSMPCAVSTDDDEENAKWFFDVKRWF